MEGIPKGVNLNVNRMEMALKTLNNPCIEIPAIQIAGTNGKGSIASFIQSGLQILDIKAGITTSPHLMSWCERICINQEPILIEEFKETIKYIKPLVAKHNLTLFELTIATALDYFRSKSVELLVLEVGLGGRLDATTAHSFRPIIAIANIGLDHCEYLGQSLEEIAKEKAAIINPNCTVISAQQHPEVVDVLNSVAIENNASINWVEPLSKEWNLGLNGDFQRYNAAVARGALKELNEFGWEINEKQIREGFACAKWPGRLQQILWKEKPIIIDCAHNPHATEQISNERRIWSREEYGVQWILGIQKNKDAPRMLQSLIKPNDIAWIVPVPGYMSWNQNELAKICPIFLPQLKSANNIEEVLSTILSTKNWPIPSPVITGSIYLIGDLLSKEHIKYKEVN